MTNAHNSHFPELNPARSPQSTFVAQDVIINVKLKYCGI